MRVITSVQAMILMVPGVLNFALTRCAYCAKYSVLAIGKMNVYHQLIQTNILEEFMPQDQNEKQANEQQQAPYYFGELKKISLENLEVYGTICTSVSAQKEIDSLELTAG